MTSSRRSRDLPNLVSAAVTAFILGHLDGVCFFRVSNETMFIINFHQFALILVFG